MQSVTIGAQEGQPEPLPLVFEQSVQRGVTKLLLRAATNEKLMLQLGGAIPNWESWEPPTKAESPWLQFSAGRCLFNVLQFAPTTAPSLSPCTKLELPTLTRGGVEAGAEVRCVCAAVVLELRCACEGFS